MVDEITWSELTGMCCEPDTKLVLGQSNARQLTRVLALQGYNPITIERFLDRYFVVTRPIEEKHVYAPSPRTDSAPPNRAGRRHGRHRDLHGADGAGADRPVRRRLASTRGAPALYLWLDEIHDVPDRLDLSAFEGLITVTEPRSAVEPAGLIHSTVHTCGQDSPGDLHRPTG